MCDYFWRAQPALHRLCADPIGIEPASIIGYLDMDLTRLVICRDRYFPAFRLARGGTIFRTFYSVVCAIADQVHNWIANSFDQLAVEFGIGALDDEVVFLLQFRGQLEPESEIDPPLHWLPAPPIDIALFTFRAPLARVMLSETVSGLLTLIVPPQELSITRSAIVKLASTSAVLLVLPLVNSAVSEVPGTAFIDQLFGLLQLLSAAPVQMSVDSNVRSSSASIWMCAAVSRLVCRIRGRRVDIIGARCRNRRSPIPSPLSLFAEILDVLSL